MPVAEQIYCSEYTTIVFGNLRSRLCDVQFILTEA